MTAINVRCNGLNCSKYSKCNCRAFICVTQYVNSFTWKCYGHDNVVVRNAFPFIDFGKSSLIAYRQLHESLL